MNNNLWAIAALSLIACGPNPGGNTDTTSSSCTECMVDSDGNEYPLGTGAIFVHATYELEQEICQVLDEDGNVIGNTEEAIFGLDPGVFNFALGDPNETSLDGRPFHVVNPYFAPTQSVPDETYTFGDSTVSVVAGEITQAEVLLELAQQHQCSAQNCSFPYEGGSCNGDVFDDPPQWVYVDLDGIIHGTENSSVVSGVEMTLIDGTFTVTATDENREIVDFSLNEETLTLSFTFVNEAFEGAQQVTCSRL